MKAVSVLLCLAMSVEAIRMAPRSEQAQLSKEVATDSSDLPPQNVEAPELTKELDTNSLAMAIFGKGNVEDFHEGEAEWLIHQLKKAGTTTEEFKSLAKVDKPKGTGSVGMTSKRAVAIAMLARKEEQALGKDMSKISSFGQAIPKLPRSWVKQITALNHTKKYRYMFSGSFLHKDVQKHRRWLGPWVKAHFGKEDYFRATDGKPNLGEFDYSATDTGGFRPKDCGGSCFKFDESYWATMSLSKFTLCPGGDSPYSFRFYESFLAGSIPVINSIEDDWFPRVTTIYINQIGYEHKKTADFPLEYDQAMVDRNLAKFIKYQTYIEGDNTPP